MSDLRFAWRSVSRHIPFSIAVVAIVALSVGVATAAFGVSDAVLFRLLPFKDPDRLVTVKKLIATGDEGLISLSEWEEWRERRDLFDELAAVGWTELDTDISGNAERMEGAIVTANFFDVLGVQALCGTLPRLDKTSSEKSRDIVIRERLWRRVFGGDASAIGRSVSVDAPGWTGQYKIVGVVSDEVRLFELPDWDFYIPVTRSPNRANWRDTSFLPLARLAGPVTRSTVSEQLSPYAVALGLEHGFTSVRGVVIRTLHESEFGELQSRIRYLMIAFGLIISIACVNLASLQLMNGSKRATEFGVRVVNGASSARLLRQLLAEAVILACVGGGVGIIVAIGACGLARAWLPSQTPRIGDITVGIRVVSFLLALTGGMTIVWGLIPAVRFSRGNVVRYLRSTGTTSRQDSRLREGLLGLQVMLVVGLLIGATVSGLSLLRRLDLDLGFRPRGVTAVEISLSRNRGDSQRAVLDMLVDRAASLPGIEAAAFGELPPESQRSGYAIHLPSGQRVVVGGGRVSDDYFKVLQVPLIGGRFLDRTDRMSIGGQTNAVVNQAFVSAFIKGGNPIGTDLSMSAGRFFHVVGVVGDFRGEDLTAPIRPSIYWPTDMVSSTWLLVRAQSRISITAAELQGLIAGVDPRIPIKRVVSLEQRIADLHGPARAYAMVLAFLSGLGLLLTAVGVYTLVSNILAERRREIGIRLAIGATSRHIIGQTLGRLGALLLIGALGGLWFGVLVSRELKSVLFKVSSEDPFSLTAVVVIIVGVVVAAAYPALRRLVGVQPIQLIRRE